MAINPDYLAELEMYGGSPRRPQFIDRERLRAMEALAVQARQARLTPARATVRDAITGTDARARIQDPRFGDVSGDFYPPGQDPRVPSARVPAPFLPRPMPLPEPGWQGDLREIGPARPLPFRPQAPGQATLREAMEAEQGRQVQTSAPPPLPASTGDVPVDIAPPMSPPMPFYPRPMPMPRPRPFYPRPIRPGELEIGPFRPRPMPLPMPRPGPGFAPTMPLIPRMTRPDPGFYRDPRGSIMALIEQARRARWR